MLATPQIESALHNARRGISQYLEIMSAFPHTNVAGDREFQRRFNAFYRIRQRPAQWYRTYYACMRRLHPLANPLLSPRVAALSYTPRSHRKHAAPNNVVAGQ